MEEIREEQGLSIADIFHMIKKHIVGIIVAIVVCTGLGMGYALFLNPISYKASTNVYVLYDGGSNDSSQAVNYGRLGPKTFSEAINSDSKIWMKIENKAIANNELLPADEQVEIPSYKVIGAGLNASYDADLESLKFSFSFTSAKAELVAPIMNATIDVLEDITSKSSIAGVEKDAFNYFKLSILGDVSEKDIATVATSKSKIVILAAAVGVVLGACYTLIYELVDQRISSKKTIEELCDLKIIGLIPELSEAQRNKGGKR